MKKFSYTFIVILAFIWIGLLFSFAISFEAPMGSVSGIVTAKNTGKPVCGAVVYHPTVYGKYVKTDKNGYYELTDVPEGRYDISVAARGYEPSYRYGVDVFEAKQTRNINFSLYIRAPYFSVYMERNNFTPNDEPSFICRGYKIENFTITVYKIDPLQNINILQNPYRLGGVNLSLFETVFKSEFKTTLNNFDEFEMQPKIDFKEEGVYIASVKPQNLKEQRILFNITDTGIITKSSPGKLLVYAVNITNGEPLSGVNIRLYDKYSKLYQTSSTGSEGVLVITPPAGSNYFVLASKGKSSAYTAGYASSGSGLYKTYLYTERPVYRPGQTVYYKGIVRRDLYNKYENAVDRNVDIQVTDSQGTVIKKASLKTDSFGTFNGEFKLSEEPDLGSYSIMTSIDRENFYQDFMVAEYKKPEYKVELAPSEKHYVGGDKITVKVDAAYYFGEPVSGARITYTAYESDYYSPFLMVDEFRYKDESAGYGRVLFEGEAKTDQDGRADIIIPTSKSDHDRIVGIEVEVQDLSLRTVSTSVSVLVTQGLFNMALKANKYIYAEGDDAKVEIKAADYDGKAVASQSIKSTVYRISYKEDGDGRVTEQKKLLKVLESFTNPEGIADISYKFDKGGNYKIESQSYDKDSNKVTASLYIWVSSGYSSSPFTKNIEAVTDKKLYNPGDTAKVLISFPEKDCKALITVEGKDIYLYNVLKVDSFSKTIELPVKEEYFPNVYIQISLVKDGQLIYHTVPLYLNVSDKKLNISIKPGKEKYKPGQTAVYDITVTDKDGVPVESQFSFGVVDEAIYAISEELCRNINKYFYGYRYGLVNTNYSFSGYYSGGLDKEGVKIRKNFKDTAYFIPDVLTDNEGKARISFVFPDNLTSWRATVKAATKNSLFGQAQDNVIVTKDLLVRLEPPRFITQNDELQIAAVVHNYTESAQKVDVEFNASGCELTGKQNKSITVGKNGAERVPFNVKANTPGEAVFTVKAISATDSDGMELKVPVIPHGILQYKAGSDIVKENLAFELVIPPNIIKEATKLNMVFAPSVGSAILAGLDYLTSYPYGCTEQTMNSFLPNVIVEQTLKKLNIQDNTLEDKLPTMINKGLKTIYSYQQSDGGWGWWEYDRSNAYLTAFVVIGLNEAKKSGINIDKYSFDRGVAAVKNFLKQKEEDFVRANYLYAQGAYINARAYLIYALSECGQAKREDVIDLFNKKEQLNNYSKALFAATLYNTGLTEEALQMAEIINDNARDYSGFTYWQGEGPSYSWPESDVETTAYTIKALVRIQPDNPNITKAFQWLITQRQGAVWISTKDTAIALSALCDYMIAKGDASPNFTAKFNFNKELLKEMSFNNIMNPPVSFNVSNSKIKQNNSVDIQKQGQGTLYSSYKLQYFVQGNDIKAESKGITVQRDYYKLKRVKTIKGDYIEKPVRFDGAIKTGEKLQVKLTLNCPNDYTYMIIEDMFPAGCEVDIAEAEKNVGSTWYQKRIVRDEKAVFFISYFAKGRHEIIYNIRGEVPGRYNILPTQAYLMYAPQVCGNSAEDKLEIK
ncbi:MAG: MG2 domain-containing protein [Armatimonadota bacterium]